MGRDRNYINPSKYLHSYDINYVKIISNTTDGYEIKKAKDVKACFENLIQDKYRDKKLIYKDGSRKDGYPGAAVWCPDLILLTK